VEEWAWAEEWEEAALAARAPRRTTTSVGCHQTQRTTSTEVKTPDHYLRSGYDNRMSRNRIGEDARLPIAYSLNA